MSTRIGPYSVRHRVACYGSNIWEDGKATGRKEACGWRGYRTYNPDKCECYSDWKSYCRATAPGPGCPSGIIWPCPRCGQGVVSVRQLPSKKTVDA